MRLCHHGTRALVSTALTARASTFPALAATTSPRRLAFQRSLACSRTSRASSSRIAFHRQVRPAHTTSQSSDHDAKQERSDRLRTLVRRVMWLPVVAVVLHHVTLASIEGGSMSPTLNPQQGDRDIVLVNRYVAAALKQDPVVAQLVHLFPFLAATLSIGDVVLYKAPFDPNLVTTKRILAMEGDIVTLHKPAARQKQNVPLLTWWPSSVSSAQPDDVDDVIVKRIRVPPGHIWVEGDASAYDEDIQRRMAGHYNLNGAQSRSRDSRDFGPIPIALVLGRIECILWPFSRAGALASRPHFDAARLQERRVLRVHRRDYGLGTGNGAHPDDSSLTPYTFWESPSRSKSRQHAEEGQDGRGQEAAAQSKEEESRAALGDGSALPLTRIFSPWLYTGGDANAGASRGSTGNSDGGATNSDESTHPSQPPRRRRRRRRGDDLEADAEFDRRWRDHLNQVSRGGQLGDHMGRDEI